MFHKHLFMQFFLKDLIHTELNILEIAIKYQYKSYSSFSRAFKRLYGVAPTVYRKAGITIEYFPKIDLKFDTLSRERMGIPMNEEKIKSKISNVNSGYILNVDIDQFMTVNDLYGRNAGDFVLAEVPIRIEKVLQGEGITEDIIRIGADEFIVVFKDLDKTEVTKIASEIINRTSNPFIYNKVEINISVSIGIVSFGVYQMPEETIKASKEQMLAAKAAGRRQYSMKVMKKD